MTDLLITRPVMWRMTLSSYTGIVAWASHYRVRLTGHTEDVEVTYLLSSADAKQLEEPDFHWKTGDLSERFITRADAITAGITAWTQLADAQRGDVLCMGDGDPAKAVAGPPGIVAEINETHDRYMAHDGVTFAAWVALEDRFEPHLRDTTFGAGAPPSVRRVVEVTLRHEGDGWVVDEVRSRPRR